VAGTTAGPTETRLEAMEADPRGVFKRVYVETYRGYKIRVQRNSNEWGALKTLIAGRLLSVPYGRTNADALREVRAARGWIDMSHERPDDFEWSRTTPDY
jgi:hypothetical protein